MAWQLKKKVADFLASGAKYVYLTRKEVERLTTFTVDEVLRSKGIDQNIDEVLSKLLDLQTLSDYTAKELRKANMAKSFAEEDAIAARSWLQEEVRKATISLAQERDEWREKAAAEARATERERVKAGKHLARVLALEKQLKEGKR